MSAASIQSTTTTTRSQNPFEAARLTLVRSILEMRSPRAYSTFPSPAEHEGVGAHIREAAAIFDEWLAAVGAEVRDNANCHIDHRLFVGSFTGAVDGNETFACEEAALAVPHGGSSRRPAAVEMMRQFDDVIDTVKAWVGRP